MRERFSLNVYCLPNQSLVSKLKNVFVVNSTNFCWFFSHIFVCLVQYCSKTITLIAQKIKGNILFLLAVLLINCFNTCSPERRYTYGTFGWHASTRGEITPKAIVSRDWTDRGSRYTYSRWRCNLKFKSTMHQKVFFLISKNVDRLILNCLRN